MVSLQQLEKEEIKTINEIVERAKALRDELVFIQKILNSKNEVLMKLYKGKYLYQKIEGGAVLEQYPTELGYKELEEHGLLYDPQRNEPSKTAMYNVKHPACVVCGWEDISATGNGGVNNLLHYAFCPKHFEFLYISLSLYKK